jgi:hypothetical protein
MRTSFKIGWELVFNRPDRLEQLSRFGEFVGKELQKSAAMYLTRIFNGQPMALVLSASNDDGAGLQPPRTPASLPDLTGTPSLRPCLDDASIKSAVVVVDSEHMIQKILSPLLPLTGAQSVMDLRDPNYSYRGTMGEDRTQWLEYGGDYYNKTFADVSRLHMIFESIQAAVAEDRPASTYMKVAAVAAGSTDGTDVDGRSAKRPRQASSLASQAGARPGGEQEGQEGEE